MNNRIDELNEKMDRCRHGAPAQKCWMCQEEDYDLRHRALLSDAIGFALFTFAVFAFTASCKGAEITDRFLDALPLIESSNQDSKIGADGERGRYQFKRIAWDQVNKILKAKGATILFNFDGATQPEMARSYARIYCEWLDAQLTRKLKRKPTAREIYAAYNLGIKGFGERDYKLPLCPKSTQEAAKRLEGML